MTWPFDSKDSSRVPITWDSSLSEESGLAQLRLKCVGISSAMQIIVKNRKKFDMIFPLLLSIFRPNKTYYCTELLPVTGK